MNFASSLPERSFAADRETTYTQGREETFGFIASELEMRVT